MDTTTLFWILAATSLAHKTVDDTQQPAPDDFVLPQQEPKHDFNWFI